MNTVVATQAPQQQAGGRTVAQASQPRSLLREIAGQYGMEPQQFAATLKATVVPANVSNEQFAAFLLVAKRYGLNPLTKEIYAFPTKGGGIQPIVSVDGWLKMINSHPEFDGMEFEDHADANGNLVAITCRIFRKDRSHPTEVTEYLAECQGALKDKWGNPTPWAKWPRRMLRHKATIQAARYAFGFSGIQDEDEFERTESVTQPPPPPPPPAQQPNAPVVEAEVVPPAPKTPSPEEEMQALENTLQQCKTVQCLQRVWERAASRMQRWPAEYQSQMKEMLDALIDQIADQQPDEPAVNEAPPVEKAPIVQNMRAAIEACTTEADLDAVAATWKQQHAANAPAGADRAVRQIIEERRKELRQDDGGAP